MTDSGQDSPDWEARLGAWLGARWQWLVAGVLLLFAFNKLVCLVVAAVGLLTFANGIAGRVLGARRVVQQVQQMVGDPDDPEEEV
jgi:hypothetical protein